MLGVYVAYSLIERAGPHAVGFWARSSLAALAVGLIGALIEVVLLRRIYRAPELFQLLATFARRAGDQGRRAVALGSGRPGRPARAGPARPGRDPRPALPDLRPAADRVGPVVLGLLWLLLARTRWGTLVRAATQDREMVGALGVNQAHAVHLGVLRSARCWRGSAARCRSRASRPISISTCRSSPTPSSSPWSAAWAALRGAFLAALLIGVAQGVLHRLGTLRLVLLQAHAGGRVRGHGAGAGDAALRPARQAAGAWRAPRRRGAAAPCAAAPLGGRGLAGAAR